MWRHNQFEKKSVAHVCKRQTAKYEGRKEHEEDIGTNGFCEFLFIQCESILFIFRQVWFDLLPLKLKTSPHSSTKVCKIKTMSSLNVLLSFSKAEIQNKSFCAQSRLPKKRLTGQSGSNLMQFGYDRWILVQQRIAQEYHVVNSPVESCGLVHIWIHAWYD